MYVAQSVQLLEVVLRVSYKIDNLIGELSQHLQPQQTWQERQDSSNESWERIRLAIFEEEIVKLALHEDDVSLFIHITAI